MARPRPHHQRAAGAGTRPLPPPGRIIIVDRRVALTLFHVEMANSTLLPGTARQYAACWHEIIDWMHPSTGLIRCAQSVLAARARVPVITVRRFFGFCREQELLCKVFHQRFSHTGAVTGLAAGYVVLASAR